MRTDLTGPDGQPGIDISGYTMQNMYLEMSKGAYTVDGAATPWVKVPHSEAWYGATRCFLNDNGEWVAGAIAGHDRATRTTRSARPSSAIDAVDALAAADPASRGPTTTSRTRATSTATATSTSPTA